nr:hypothetical protein CFP56_06504 [Quercus suber]
MDFKEGLSWMIRTKQNTEWFSVTIWSIWTYQIPVRTNQPWCNPNQLTNIAKNYIDTMFQEEDRAVIGVIIRECQRKSFAHMVEIILLPLIVIELETLAISKALQFDADLSLEDVTPEGVSEIAMNVLNADSQSLESFGLLSRDVKCFASLFHCIRFSHARRERLLYSHIKYGWKMSHPILVRFYNWM